MNADSTWGQALSDLADGRANATQLDAVMAAWDEQPALRQQWQALHLIGDTLRSGELAQQAQSGESLLAGLRARLADEPPRLPAHRLRDWMAPLAVAAGFVALAMALPSLQAIVQPDSLPVIAGTDTSPLLGQTLNGGEPSFVQAAGLREASLDTGAQAASGVTSDPARR